LLLDVEAGAADEGAADAADPADESDDDVEVDDDDADVDSVAGVLLAAALPSEFDRLSVR
jgi:hypothetical protein